MLVTNYSKLYTFTPGCLHLMVNKRTLWLHFSFANASCGKHACISNSWFLDPRCRAVGNCTALCSAVQRPTARKWGSPFWQRRKAPIVPPQHCWWSVNWRESWWISGWWGNWWSCLRQLQSSVRATLKLVWQGHQQQDKQEEREREREREREKERRLEWLRRITPMIVEILRDWSWGTTTVHAVYILTRISRSFYRLLGLWYQ